jgi:hypothetical protein
MFLHRSLGKGVLLKAPESGGKARVVEAVRSEASLLQQVIR